MLKYLLFAAVTLVMFASCATTAPKLTPDQEMIGTWTTQMVRVKINSVYNTTSDSVIIASSNEFEEKLGLYSNVGHYRADGTYSDLYYVSKDSVALEITGTWAIKGDSIVIAELMPVQRTHVYQFKYKKDKAIFKGMIDWDGDGQKDDEYTGILTKGTLKD